MQPDLFSHQPIFDGDTIEPVRDTSRLAAQLGRVTALMRDGRWRTLAEISQTTGDPESSVSARLRDLRKVKHGLWTVERRYVERGLFEYRVMR